jgi:hypothetical protein
MRKWLLFVCLFVVCLFVRPHFSHFVQKGSCYLLVMCWPMLLCLSNAICSKVIMFIYDLNTFVCCCIRNLNFLFRLFCSGCWYLSVWIIWLLHACTKFWCQFCAVGIFQFESFDYSTRAQNFGVNFVGIILQLKACKKNLVAKFVGLEIFLDISINKWFNLVA